MHGLRSCCLGLLTLAAFGGGITVRPEAAEAAQITITGAWLGGNSAGSATEPSIAVGPNHIFAQQQGDLRVFNKSGVQTYAPECQHLLYNTLDNCQHPGFLFDSEATCSPVFDQPSPHCNVWGGKANDPVAAYDPFAQRYYALVMTNGTGSYHLHLAVSHTSNLDDGWCVYHVNATQPAGCQQVGYIDRPTIGFSNDKIVVTFLVGGSCAGSTFRVFDKTPLLNGTAGTQFHEHRPNIGHFDLHPQHYQDVALAGIPNTNTARVCRNLTSTNDIYVTYLSGTTARVSKICGQFPNLTQETVTHAFQGVGSPLDAPQKDLSQNPPVSYLDANRGGAQFSEPFYRNNVITMAWHAAGSGSYAGVNVVRVLRLRATDANPLTDLTHGQTGMHYCYPSVTEDAQGNLYLGFNATNETIFPSSYITAKPAADANFMVPPILARAGETAFRRFRDGSIAYGDFTGIQLDETETPPSANYLGQYSKAEGSSANLAAWFTRFVLNEGGGGGGGCPVAETETETGWRRENTILSRSSTREVASDGYRLKHRPAAARNRVRLRIREDEEEITQLDRVSLANVDHSPAEVACMLEGKTFVGRLGAPWTLSAGGAEVSTPQSAGASSLVRPGTEVIASAPASRPKGPGGPIQIEGGGKELDSVSPVGDDPTVVPTDEWLTTSTGIDVDRRSSSNAWGSWRRVQPREELSELWLPDPGDAELRLSFVGGHRLAKVRRLEDSREVTPMTARIVSANHSRLGEVLPRLSAVDGNLLELRKGDVLTFEFEVPAAENAKQRDYFLVTDGYYTSSQAKSSPGRPGVLTPTIHRVRPNPFSREVLIEFSAPANVPVEIEIFDLAGRKVRTILRDRATEGSQVARWDGHDQNGSRSPSGVYFVRLRAENFVQETTAVLVDR